MAYKFQMGEAILSGSTTFEEALAGLDTLDVSGQLSGASDLKIGGAAQIAGNADLNGQLDVAGDTKLAAPGVGTQIRGDFTVDEGAQFASSLQVQGLLSGSSNLELAGNADLNGQLDVAGDTKLAASGIGTQIRGDLTVDEAAQFDSTVGIALKANLADELQVDGDVDINAQLDVSGDTKLAAPGVGTQIRGDLTVDQVADFADAVTMQSTLDVDGEATLASAIIEDLQAGRVPYISGSGAMVDNQYLNVQAFGPNPFLVVGSGSFGGALSASVHGPAQSLWFNNSPNPYAYMQAEEFNFHQDFTLRSSTQVFECAYDTTIDATLDVSGDTKLAASGVGTQIRGDLTVEEAAQFNSQVTFNAPLTASSHMKVNGLLSGNAGVFAGNFELNGPLHANGSATFYNSLHVDGGAVVNQLQIENLTAADGGIVWSDAVGDLFDNANFKYLHASNELQVVGGKVSASLLQLASNADIAGGINVVGNIMGDGLLNVQNHVSSAANLMAGGHLMLAGNANIDGNLTALGTSNLVVLTASADSVFEQNLHVMGDLDIDGDIIFNGNLEVDGDFQVDGTVTFTNVAGTMDIAADSMYFLDDTDGQLKSYSWSTLMSDIAGPGLSAAGGQLSTDAAAAPVAWVDGAGLVEGVNYIAADTAVDFSGTLPSAPSVGDRIICKAKGVSGGAQVKILTDGGVSPAHRIDGSETEAIIESPYGAITLVYVAANDWRIL